MDLEGNLAPPMENGEVVFEWPWQGRVFGMARSLCEAGYFEWDEFREYLIAEIEIADRDDPTGFYYDRFLNALSKLIDARGICTAAEIVERTAVFAARPHGHDHDH